MNIELLKWNREMKNELIHLCNRVDRSYLSDRMPEPYTETDADWWLGMVSEHDGVDGLFRAISVDGRIAGSISVECKSDVYRRDGEIGYMLLDEYRSQGIMTEAVKLMTREAFEKLDILRITGIVYAENTASQRVLEKNGFVPEGLQRKAACKRGKMHDIFLYGKLREDNTAVSVDRMRRSDAYTIDHFVPGKELMRRAAYGVYSSYDSWKGRRIAIIAGGGNNGGDGYALAGILKENGIDSVVYKVSDKLSEDGRFYCDKARASGVAVLDFHGSSAGNEASPAIHGSSAGSEAIPDANGSGNCGVPGSVFRVTETGRDDAGRKNELAGYDVIVDCMLGTGFRGEVRGRAAEAIRAINDTDAYVISVDINSGLNGDTGEAALAVRSDLTVSIGYYKKGLFTGDSHKYIKRMVNVDIGIVLLDE